MQFLTVAVFAVAAATQVAAICPGFNYGITNQKNLGNGVSQWLVYDDSCNQVDGLTTTGNPCDEGIFGCTPPPITFNRYTSTFTGLVYTCRPDSNSGSCGGDTISVCCRNDGN